MVPLPSLLPIFVIRLHASSLILPLLDSLLLSSIRLGLSLTSTVESILEARSGINGEISEIAEIEAASTGEAARLRDALRRAPPGAVRQPHHPFERITQT
ncbi:hypothetical protein ZEAMMB73_Zm00001d044044 [Zea mays]|uniref:Uncharacterized protein n=1 Tax=Zea mays TaxID=4577 RepID=A0A1D6NHG6_MAIZE|nr:hypothetical protein ZEAMMB73_Zm00001d044044 [Zea mays]ONM39827.1 hypothetical protein ZEAMMB73_Zm00001d044044 [Zea mays]